MGIYATAVQDDVRKCGKNGWSMFSSVTMQERHKLVKGQPWFKMAAARNVIRLNMGVGFGG
jgi:hypothetical protein